MNPIPNSMSARDAAYVVHPQTNLKLHEQEGARIFTSGEGIHVYDDAGKEFIDGGAGLWCASLGFSSERLAKVAYEQMRKLGFYHTYRSTSNEPCIGLAEKLMQIAPVPMSKVLLQCSASCADCAATVTKKPDTPGARGVSRKAIAQGVPSDLGVPVSACVRLFCFARKAVGAACTRLHG
jgi:4-aminobutyrate aminotransferase-like enzyme